MIMDYTDSIKKIYSNISSCDFDREVDVRFDNKYSLFSSAANLVLLKIIKMTLSFILLMNVRLFLYRY